MVSFMVMLLLYMNMFTNKPFPLDEPPLSERIQPNDLSKGIVEPKLAEAEPDILPSSATFIVNTVTSIGHSVCSFFIPSLVIPYIHGELGPSHRHLVVCHVHVHIYCCFFSVRGIETGQP